MKQLRRASRRHSKKKKGSKNREKSRLKLAIIHEKVSNSRRDFLYKLTSGIVKNQNYTSVAIEDLNVSEMLKQKKNKLSRHITDAGWGYFRQFLTYKCQRAGKNLLVIGRFEPSSKLCPCGRLNNSLTLKNRVWTCECGNTHDRDILAARNIRHFAFCSQNTKSTEFLGAERPEFTPLESDVSCSLKKETAMVLT